MRGRQPIQVVPQKIILSWFERGKLFWNRTFMFNTGSPIVESSQSGGNTDETQQQQRNLRVLPSRRPCFLQAAPLPQTARPAVPKAPVQPLLQTKAIRSDWRSWSITPLSIRFGRPSSMSLKTKATPMAKMSPSTTRTRPERHPVWIPSCRATKPTVPKSS